MRPTTQPARLGNRSWDPLKQENGPEFQLTMKTMTLTGSIAWVLFQYVKIASMVI
jgi:hypothetical protein